MVVLVITRSSWSTDNNAGNTLSSLFEGMDCEFHSLYLRAGTPKNQVAKSYYHITERQILRSLIGRAAAGSVVDVGRLDEKDERDERRVYDAAKRWGGSVLWLARELLWVVGRWKTRGLDAYLDLVKPDIVFMPAFGCVYPYDVLDHVLRRTTACAVLFHTDDYVSLRQFRVSPVYWLTRIVLRRRIRRAARGAAINYCITQEQADEYTRTLGCPCRLLQKGGDFTVAPRVGSALATGERSDALRFIYTGNLSSGRWKSLVAIGRALGDIGANAVMDVYSQNTLMPKVSRAFNSCESLVWRGEVGSEQVVRIQESGDVLVHVESLQLRERLETRLALSTKIVDYFARGRCIFAVGWEKSASIAYLRRNGAASIASNEREIHDRLVELVRDDAIRNRIADAAWQCGVLHHDRQAIQGALMEDFRYVMDHGECGA